MHYPSTATARSKRACVCVSIGHHCSYFAGGRYRFRFIDGHWHAGLVVALQHVDGPQQLNTGGSSSASGRATPRQEAVVRFLHPTQCTMLGGVQLPASALQVGNADDAADSHRPNAGRCSCCTVWPMLMAARVKCHLLQDRLLMHLDLGLLS